MEFQKFQTKFSLCLVTPRLAMCSLKISAKLVQLFGQLYRTFINIYELRAIFINKKGKTLLTPAMYLKSSLNMIPLGCFFHRLDLMISNGFIFSKPEIRISKIRKILYGCCRIHVCKRGKFLQFSFIDLVGINPQERKHN